MILAIVLSITTGFVINNNNKNMVATYSSQDLPEHGLIIIKPSDPEFNHLATILQSEKEILDFEKIKPFSIFLKNNNTKAIVGHSIVWQFTDSSGGKTEQAINYVNSPALTDGEFIISPNDKLNQSIPAGGYKFLTLIPNAVSGGTGGGGSSSEVFDKNNTDKSKITDKQELNIETESIYRHKLDNGSEIFISLSGAFFEDGLFVGVDTTNFFDLVNAHVKAKRDLDAYVNSMLKKGSSYSETLNHGLQEKTEKNLESFDLSKPEGQYNLTTKTFATFYLKLNQLSDKAELRAKVEKSKNHLLPTIKKL